MKDKIIIRNSKANGANKWLISLFGNMSEYIYSIDMIPSETENFIYIYKQCRKISTKS